MKIKLAIGIALFCSLQAWAQDTPLPVNSATLMNEDKRPVHQPTFKPMKGDKGFMFGLTGVSGLRLSTANTPTGTLGFRYMTNDKVQFRAGVKFGSSTQKTKSDTSGTGIDTTVISKRSNWALSMGFQRSLGTMRRLDPFIGGEAWFGGTNGSLDTKTEVVSASSSGSLGDYSQTVSTGLGKGRNYGIRLFTGFNYFIADHLSLGAEFGYGLYFSKTTNGNATTTKTGSTFGPAGTTVTSNSARSETQGFVPDGSGMITVSVYF